MQGAIGDVIYIPRLAQAIMPTESYS